MKKTAIARKIESWMKKNDLLGAVRIYFNNKCWCWYDGSKKIIEDIKGSEYFEYANDDTISISFEGQFHSVMNYGYSNRHWDKLSGEFDKILDGFDCWYELGNAWNLSIYEQ
jgi:hypothetical protein